MFVLHYLLIHGSEQVIIEARVHVSEIRTLTDFRDTAAYPENGRTVRERAYDVMALMNDEENLRAARANAQK